MIHAVTVYLYLDPKFGSHEIPRLAKRARLGLGGTLALAASLSRLLPFGARVLVIAVPPNYVDRSTANKHEVSKSTGQESQTGSAVGFLL